MENLSEELPDKEAGKIKDMYNDASLPADMENKIIDRLKGLQLIHSSPAARFWRLAAMIILIPVLFAAGYYSGKNNLKLNNMDTTTTSNYALLLYHSKDFIENEEEHVKEYGAWLKNLQQQGKLASGEKLRDNAWLLKGQNKESITKSETDKGILGGFFIINAASESEALTVANSCPHLKYNGLIEVRPIEPTN